MITQFKDILTCFECRFEENCYLHITLKEEKLFINTSGVYMGCKDKGTTSQVNIFET